jgi:Protein of unknown function (DUF2867)
MTKETNDIVEKVKLPEGSLVASLVLTERFADHADAFRARVDPARFPDVDAFAHAFLEQEPPTWIAAAMRTRDVLVGSLFGLKTSKDVTANDPTPLPETLVPGVRRGIFRILQRTPNEILMGEDDSHLDFRVSLFHERIGDDVLVIVSTVVRFHNALGRAYFVPVRPVHGRIVPAMMRRVLGRAL